MSRVLRRPLAERDLREIWKYIAQLNDTAATKLLMQIDAKLSLLADNPLIGRKREDLRPNLRSFAFRRYAIYYHPRGGGIELVRVVHAARHVNAAFFED